MTVTRTYEFRIDYSTAGTCGRPLPTDWSVTVEVDVDESVRSFSIGDLINEAIEQYDATYAERTTFKSITLLGSIDRTAQRALAFS